MPQPRFAKLEQQAASQRVTVLSLVVRNILIVVLVKCIVYY